MKKMTIALSSLVIIGAIIYELPTIKAKSYEREVDSLAFSYRVYSSSICPNRVILKGIRDDYIKTIDEGNVSKLSWVNTNFDRRFMSTCLQMNPHRGEYR